MKRRFQITVALLFVLATLFLVSCEDIGNPLLPTRERVTFALVINTRIYNGKQVIASLREDVGGPTLETIQGAFVDYPNTATEAWAQMTTLEKIWTNQRYFLSFYIDMDDSGTKTAGDLEGVQHFDVTSNAVWSETKYFFEELALVL